MNIIEPFILGLVLSADSFSAAIALGTRPHRLSDALKFATSSGSAEMLATFLGAIAGEKVLARFSLIGHWIAFILLFLVASHMLYESITFMRNGNGNSEVIKFHGFFKIVIVSLATSIDALAVGVSLGVTKQPLFLYLFFIGGWAFASTIIGMAIAKKAPKRLSTVFNFIGALIIFILAFGMLNL